MRDLGSHNTTCLEDRPITGASADGDASLRVISFVIGQGSFVVISYLVLPVEAMLVEFLFLRAYHLNNAFRSIPVFRLRSFPFLLVQI